MSELLIAFFIFDTFTYIDTRCVLQWDTRCQRRDIFLSVVGGRNTGQKKEYSQLW